MSGAFTSAQGSQRKTHAVCNASLYFPRSRLQTVKFRTPELVDPTPLYEEIRMSREAAPDFSPGRMPGKCCFGTSSPERRWNIWRSFHPEILPGKCGRT